MNEHWWRVRVSSEMYEGTANLQSRCKCAERSFSDRPSSATGVSCHTARQGLRHPPSVESEAPNYPPEADSYVTGRGNSSDVLLHRGGSTCVPQGSIGHRAQPVNELEEETRPLTDLQL